MFKKFPIRLIVIAKRQGGEALELDRARDIRDAKSGKIFLRLKRAKTDIEPPKYDFVINRGNHKYLMLYSPAPGEYYPMKINDREIKAIPENIKFAFMNTVIKAHEKYQERQSKLMAYLPMISIVMFAVAFAIVLFVMTDYMSTIASQLGSVANSMQQAMTTAKSVSSPGF